MKKILLIFFMSMLSFSALAEEWLVVETTKEYQVKILQPHTKYKQYNIVWQKLLLFNRIYYYARVIWDCEEKKYKTEVLISGYHDEPPTIKYIDGSEFKQLSDNNTDQLIFKIVCKQ